MGVVKDFLFDNAYAVDAKGAEESVRSKYPGLLHADESIELAFKDRGGKGRDKKYFTTHRILIKDGKGVGGKRKNYTSVPYDTILAFSVQSAGPSMLDGDSELVIHSTGIAKVTMDFSAENVDIFQLYQLLNTKIRWTKDRGTSDFVDPVPPNMDKRQTAAGNMIDWLGDNAKQVDAGEIEAIFKSQYPVLLEDEKVELAFKSGRDTKCFTNRRILFVDVKGLMGKKIEFLTVPYSSIHGYFVQTAGALDRDTELRLYTNMIGELYQMNQDFRNGKANLWSIQKVLCNHVLGEDEEPLPGIESYQGHQDSTGGLFGLITGLRFNNRPIDSVAMDEALHHDPPILQGSERVEMAFQGHRDIAIFTTKRLLTIDKKGLVGKRVEYFSIPWEKFVAFGIRSAGYMIDFDTEVQLYTEMGFYPGEPGSAGDENNPPTPPIPARPEESCFELDFNKNAVDIYKLKLYLSQRIMKGSKIAPGAPIDVEALTVASPDPKGFERLFQWLGGDQRELDPNELDAEFHNNTKILLDDEKVMMAFKAGRDLTLFTNLRIMMLDTQGLVGCKVEYTSVPYRSIHAYTVETAGMWDRDSELYLYTRNRWHLAKISMDFRSGKTDIMQIQKLLSGFVIGLPSDPKISYGPKNYANHERNSVGMNSLAVAFFDNSKEVEVGELDAKFHSEIPILLDEEKILRAFCQARDMFLFTNRRLLIVDTKGMTGQRVNYRSIPWKYVDGFEFETAGHMDRDAEIYCFTTISDIKNDGIPRSVSLLRTKQSILVKTTDIYEIGKLILEHTAFGEKPDDVVPEFDIIVEAEESPI